MGDISAEIEKLRGAREETPAVSAVPSAAPRSLKPAVETIKQAKKSEFPVAPGSGAVEKRAVAKKGGEKKKAKEDVLERLMKLMEEEDSD